jgi:hypothetical protein
MIAVITGTPERERTGIEMLSHAEKQGASTVVGAK